MECHLCGTANRVGARFCGGCGSPLARQCPSCKAELDAGLRFCDQCGAAVEETTPPAPTAPPVPSAEPASAVRKTVTVLFADLGGSTGFGERTDPEIARQVLATYHSLLQDSIDAHGGTVAKFMGDGMMATFGIPEVAEDDAERAVRAGIDIQDRFQRFAEAVAAQHGETLVARIGVNTGEVVIGAGDADLVGDALNVAARLEKACRPGQVLVGDETWRLTRGVLAYEPLGEVTVAGREQPVGTYEVDADESRAVEPVAPFVGRDAELDRLVAAFDRACDERTAVLVTVLGSPGLGKTRLSRELAGLVGSRAATTYEIRCDRAGGSTFGPIADLVRAAAGLEDTESDGDGSDARERIGTLLPDESDRGRVVDALVGVLGIAATRSVEETFWAIRRTLESLARDRPLLVVIDDVQWAEPKLLDLVEHLGEWVTGAPVLLVTLARPELRELRPSLVEVGRRVYDVVALDGLDSGATEALATGLLGSALPRELVDRLPTSTDGNPLFVRELVRMLVDDSVIRRTADGTWELAIDADAVQVPPTIQSLLATRVERLPTDELRVLELASVVGAEFSVGALRALTGDELAVPTLLERMRRKELVEPTGTYWGDEPIHRFHHVLIRDAAYRRLLKGTRAELHQRIGEWTDATASQVIGEHEVAIAFHYEQAHRYRTELGTVDGETDRLGRRAAELFAVAARRALERDDLTSAGSLAERALAILPASDVDTRAELLLMACECQLASGDVGRGTPLVDELVTIGAGDEQLTAWAECFRAQLVGLTDPDRLVEAEAAATRAAATLRTLEDGAGEAKAHQVRALLLARLGRVGEAEAVLDLALGAARAVDDRRRVTAVLGAAPQAALFGPSPVARAGGRCLDVVRLLRITTASPSVEATSMRCQAVLEALRGRFDVSRSMLASARASLEELGLRHGLLETDLFTGMVELLADDPGAAVAPLRSAYEGLDTLGVGADAGQAAALLATALLAQGEIYEAELIAAASEALAGQNLKTAIAWRTARAAVLAARGEVAEAVALARRAVDIAAATDRVLDHADACVVLAELRDQAGDATGAREARAEALRLYEAKGATVPAERIASTPAPAVTSPAATPVAEHQSDETVTTVDDPASGVVDEDRLDNAAVRAAAALIVTLDTYLRTGELVRSPLVKWTDDYVSEDRRSIVAMPTLDRDDLFGVIRTMRDQGYRAASEHPVAVRGEHLCLTSRTLLTVADDETRSLALTEIDTEGRMTRGVLFDAEDLATALAELDRRFALDEGAHPSAGSAPALENRATEALRASGETRAIDTVAVRGELLALVRLRADDPARSRLRLVEVDADGELAANVDFGDDELHAAVEALDRRFALGEGSPHLHVLRACAAFHRASVANDIEALRSVLAPDMVMVDHRPMSFLSGGAEHYLAMEAARREVSSFDSIAQTIAIVGSTLLATTEEHLVTREGSDYGYGPGCSLVEIDAEGRVRRLEWYPGDRYTDALARVRELEAPSAQPEIENTASRTIRTMIERINVGDWVGAGELDATAEDIVRFDRRKLVAAPPIRGAEAFALNAMAFIDVFDHVEPEVVAVRGERLALIRLHCGNPPDFVLRILCLYELDQDGRLAWEADYDDDDLPDALAELDQRYLGGENVEQLHEPGTSAAPSRLRNAASDVELEVARRIRAGETDGITQLLTPGFAIEDRRSIVNLGRLDAAGSGRNLALMREQGYELVIPETLAIRGERLSVSRRAARTAAGDESELLGLIELDESGRCSSVTFFDADDLDGALAEMDIRYAAGEGASDPSDAGAETGFSELARGAGTAGPDNAAVRLITGASALIWTDLEAALDHFASDAAGVAREPGPTLGAVAVNREMWRDVLSSLAETYDEVRFTAIAVRGDRVALLRQEFATDGYVTPALLLVELDEQGLISGIETLAEDDLVPAIDGLDARYAAAYAPLPAIEAQLLSGYRTLNRRAWDDFERHFSPDLTIVDHRRIGFPPGRGGTTLRRELQQLVQQVPDVVACVTHLESTGDVAIATTHQTANGGDTTWDFHTVVSLDPARGLIARHEYFDADCREEAEAVYGEWTVAAEPRTPAIDNACVRAIGRHPVAVRGDRLALFAGGKLVEIDDAGRTVREARFDEADLIGALATLDAWHLESLGDAATPAERGFVAGSITINRRDPAAYERCLVPDVTVLDHLPLNFPPASHSSEFRRMLERLYQLAPDTMFVTSKIYVADRASLGVLEQFSTTPQGNRYHWVRHTVQRYSPDGRVEAAEYFPEDRWDDAVARFEEWAAATGGD